MDSRGADVGDEDNRDEAKRMGETYASIVLALYVEDPLVCSWEVHLWIWD